jgi:hypothetical protein
MRDVPVERNLLYSYVRSIDAYISYKQDPQGLIVATDEIPMPESLQNTVDHYNQSRIRG